MKDLNDPIRIPNVSGALTTVPPVQRTGVGWGVGENIHTNHTQLCQKFEVFFLL